MKWGIANIKGSGGASNTMLATTTDATENSGTYTLALSNLSETPKVNDYVAYVDSGTITTLYKVSAIGSTNATLVKVGDIGGGGKQLYWQQYQCYQSYTDASHPGFSFVFQIYTDTELNINNKTKLIEFLASKGLKDTAPRLEVLYGELTKDDGTTWRKIEAIHTNSGGSAIYAVCPKYSSVGEGASISRDNILLPNLAISRMFSIKL